jgi:hypothetical protein
MDVLKAYSRVGSSGGIPQSPGQSAKCITLFRLPKVFAGAAPSAKVADADRRRLDVILNRSQWIQRLWQQAFE